jgi:hypothetical protein
MAIIQKRISSMKVRRKEGDHKKVDKKKQMDFNNKVKDIIVSFP